MRQMLIYCDPFITTETLRVLQDVKDCKPHSRKYTPVTNFPKIIRTFKHLFMNNLNFIMKSIFFQYKQFTVMI